MTATLGRPSSGVAPDALLAQVLAGSPPPVEAVDRSGLSRLLSSGLAPLAVSLWREGVGLAALPQELVADYHRAALHTTLVLETRARARRVLTEHGVESLDFKGVALHRAGVYRDPGARPVEDADLLVPPEQAPRAVQALAAAGFRPWTPWTPERMEWLSSITLSDGNTPGDVEGVLDLHWATPYTRLRLAPPWGRDPLWEDARDGLPTPEAHLALVAEHFLKHLRVVRHLRGLGDVVRLLERVQDPERLQGQATARGSLPGLRRLLTALESELAIPVPSEVRSTLGLPSGPDPRTRALLGGGRLLDAAPQEASRPGGILSEWTLLPSRRRALAELFRVLVPGRRWLRARYPESGPFRRLRYLRDVARWIQGSGASPLSPNQEGV